MAWFSSESLVLACWHLLPKRHSVLARPHATTNDNRLARWMAKRSAFKNSKRWLTSTLRPSKCNKDRITWTTSSLTKWRTWFGIPMYKTSSWKRKPKSWASPLPTKRCKTSWIRVPTPCWCRRPLLTNRRDASTLARWKNSWPSTRTNKQRTHRWLNNTNPSISIGRLSRNSCARSC